MLILDPKLKCALVTAMGDMYSRRILLATIDRPKSIEDLSSTETIPIASCYRRANELRKEGLLHVERIVISDDGKKYELYRCTFKSFKIEVGEVGELKMDALPNEGIFPRSIRHLLQPPSIEA